MRKIDHYNVPRSALTNYRHPKSVFHFSDSEQSECWFYIEDMFFTPSNAWTQNLRSKNRPIETKRIINRSIEKKINGEDMSIKL